LKKKLSIAAVVLILAGGIAGYMFYHRIFDNNLSCDKKEYELLIPTGSTYARVQDILRFHGILKNENSFNWVAGILDYPEKVHPGRYVLKYPMSNKDILLMLRSGRQTPVKLVINKFRTKRELSGFVGRKLEADSIELYRMLSDTALLDSFELNPESGLALFIPNTYEFYWNTSARKFLDKMHSEYQKFWTEERKRKAEAQGLDPIKVSVLASIVEEETQKKTERPTIAGVYLNRLRTGMKLQADPTVKYAVQDFALTRITGIQTGYASPYNTYLNTGLPPGPICTPSINALESVLNAEKHNYMYFCASVDSPGYHAFAETFSQHLQYARKYWHKQNQTGNVAPEN
jgi:UPF0755 protein